MFISLDESIGNAYNVVGCLCIPLDLLPSLENKLLKTRIETKCWGELDWSGISSTYVERYKDIIHEYLRDGKVTFHSWAYENPEPEYTGDRGKLLYKHEFLLFKFTLMKCLNAGYRNFYVLLDSGRSVLEYDLTRDYLDKTIFRPVKPVIDFFKSVDSRIIGAMQITSMCTSAVRHTYESEATDENKVLSNQIVELLNKLNSGTPINFNPPKPVWNLSRKFSHCLFDPKLKKPEFNVDS